MRFNWWLIAYVAAVVYSVSALIMPLRRKPRVEFLDESISTSRNQSNESELTMELDHDDLFRVTEFIKGLNKISNESGIDIGSTPIYYDGEQLGIITLSSRGYTLKGA